MERHQVFIVKEGGFARLESRKGDYDEQVGPLRKVLDEAETDKPGTGGGEKEKACDVHVVTSTSEALSRALVLPNLPKVTFVFITRGMLLEAKKIKEQHGRRIRVVVLTAAFPDDEVIILNKRVMYRGDFARDAILKW